MKSSTILSLVGVAAVMLVIGTAVGSIAFPMTKTETTTILRMGSTSNQPVTLKETVTSYSTILSGATTTIFSQTAIYSSANSTGNNVFMMEVNGSFYYADDISSDIEVGNPGYSYFLNGSITFSGVKFETICPPSSMGCPVATASTVSQTETVMIGLISLNVTFPDHSNETFGGIIGDQTYVFSLSHHPNPRVGILIEYVSYNYPNNVYPPYHAFLLIST